MAHKVIISGGGTGGHIFPAIAIANALGRIAPDVEILFVGANGRMEMDRVPAAGYEIIGLDIQGIDRKSILKNLLLPFKLLRSLLKARKIIKEFKADVAVGVGGYASGPLLMMANILSLPTLIQEQNSYAGVTNKSLGKKAKKICVAYPGMEKFFPAEKLVFTGNPIRRESVDIKDKKAEALSFFGLEEGRKTILVTGGSLGARTLNKAVLASLDRLQAEGIQVIWQCGSTYHTDLQANLEATLPKSIVLLPFLQRMDYAYAAADLIVSRAGAGTISELCVIGKPVLLIPSPNVAEDHQTKNALALVDKGAAVMLRDAVAEERFFDVVMEIMNDAARAADLCINIQQLARLEADEDIAKEVLKLIK